jgi:uncharacterized protein with LGFP repeats
MYTRIGRRVCAAVAVAALCFFSSPAGAASASTSEDPYAKQVLDLMNAQRATAGLPALRWNQSISNISQDWSNHLATATNSPTFSFATIHRPDAGGNEIPAGSDWYREIIGFNFTPADIVDWWAGSPAHRDAMLSGCATDVGIGYTVPKSGPYAGFHLVVSNLAGYPGAGTIPVRNGAVLSAWVAQGCSAGRLGQPTAPEAPAANGGVYQGFGHGMIYWSAATGAHTVWGGIAAKWGTQGSEAGRMGYPTSDEIPAANGGASQSFQYGTIYWSPTTGAHISWGGIRTAWAAQGYEGGLLGYPMSDEYVLTPGVIAQDYQGGRITWSAVTGTKVSLRN